jgi:penicillin amidase
MPWKENLLYPILGSALKTVLWTISRRRLPRIKGKLVLEGPTASVEVLRDRWGVPHILAENASDAVFAQGLVHAQERLWQMDFTRRVVSGRLAEVLGEAAVPIDRVMRTLGFRRVTEREAAKLSGNLLRLLNAYCAGVNAWITAVGRGKLPVEFVLLGYAPEPWRIEDTLGWGKIMSWNLASNWQSEFYRGEIIRRLGPEKAAELEIDIDTAWAVILDLGRRLGGGGPADAARPFAGPRVGDGVGSNNWVVHGTRTDTGTPLLANDMHLELTAPCIWFENHLAGGELDVTGVSLPGVPMIIAGHNRCVAWGYTAGCPDVQDLYEEHLRRTDGGWEYEFKGQWLPAEARREEIRVKGGKTVVEEVVSTRHGPVINLLIRDAFPDAPPLALRWTALDPDQTFQSVLDMNLARDGREFREAIRRFENPSQNVVYADTQGNIGYAMSGRVPVRAKGDGSIPAPGWTGEYEWIGYVPFDEMPRLDNPPCGYIATANNQVQRPDFPYFIGKDYLVSERAGRIIELLDAREKIDVAYIRRMQFDQVAFSARILARRLGTLQVTDADLRPVVEGMRGWDGKLDPASPLASVFEATSRAAVRMMLERRLGELGPRVQGKGPFAGQWPDHTWEWFVHLLDKEDSPWFDLGRGERRDDVLRLALRQAVDFLKQELGTRMQDWQWGRLHQLTFGHVIGGQKPMDRVFNIGPFPIGGDGNTIWNSFTSLWDLERRQMIGPPFRFIADLGDLDHCWGLLAPGQSGHLASSHYRDGVKPWFTGGYHPMLFRRDEIERNLEARLVLAPR